MSKSASVGTTLTVDTKVVGGLKSIDGIDVNADSVEVTDLANSTGYKEFVAGFKDPGEVSVSGYMDGTDEGQNEMYTLLNSGTIADCSIKFPTAIGKTWTFKAVVTEFKTGVDVSDAITFDAKLKISGAPTLAATAAG